VPHGHSVGGEAVAGALPQGLEHPQVSPAFIYVPVPVPFKLSVCYSITSNYTPVITCISGAYLLRLDYRLGRLFVSGFGIFLLSQLSAY
jgi:hypothetical protein